MEYILYATIASLLECRNVSLLGVQRMLVDPSYRNWVVRQIDDVLLKQFWTHEFERYDRRMLSEVLSPIQNKIGQFLLAAPVRNIVGQVRNRFEPRYIMDHHKILIAKLSKGVIGADKANLLGAALISQFEVAAMSRADIDESERQDFFLYVDEFHNFSTDSFALLLSEARKYRLNLTLSHQYLAQLGSGLRDAVFGNVGSLMTFRVSGTDAERIAVELGSAYGSEHLAGLARFQVCARPLLQGVQQEAFLGATLRHGGQRHNLRERIIRRSRDQHNIRRESAQRRIEGWLSR
jgi:hypothetical protein